MVRGFANHVETHLPGAGRISVPGLLGELDAPRHCHSDRWRSNGSIGQDRVDAVGNHLQQMLEDLPGGLPVSFFDELGERELAGAVDGHEEVRHCRSDQWRDKAHSMRKKPMGYRLNR
ncbi:hypothetical protein [Rhodovulum sulfidophilum]|uniref:hypothetical protein n=1 Tax=Rhodovulum sulfidophilum TaxID=35806 RepID=UPI0019206031|nr:hypothetical protein [Rhodovulum sulfidophilum]